LLASTKFSRGVGATEIRLHHWDILAPVPRNRGQEQPADWDAVWFANQNLDNLHEEEHGLRWRVQRDLVTQRFGHIDGLRVIEIGAGLATNALLYGLRGAQATVLDQSSIALERSQRRFAQHNLAAEIVQADVFELPAELLGTFQVAMSFGLCEHFLADRRRQVVGAHVDLLAPDGIAIVNVPNKYSPLYRAWMGLLKYRGTWPLGTEVPFSARELCHLARSVGAVPLDPVHVGGLGTLVNHGINPILRRLGVSEVPVPQVQIPILDLLAYDLLVPMVRAS
jgi:SAM-dependent methyltransferase